MAKNYFSSHLLILNKYSLILLFDNSKAILKGKQRRPSYVRPVF